MAGLCGIQEIHPRHTIPGITTIIMRPLLSLLCMSITLSAAHAAPPAPIPLWPDGAPGALGKKDKDIPTLTAYLPAAESATGAAMVICPGGGYGFLADHEGKDYAEWLAKHGVAGIVLKYRLPKDGYLHPAPLDDARRALRLTRAMAAEWKINAARVGIMGTSAGGHLAATLLTNFDTGTAGAKDPVERFSSRPDLGILCYPVITMGEHTHEGSRTFLLGKNPDPALVEKLSAEKQVSADTPPCFIWHTWEDPAVKVENPLMFATALREAGVPFDLHIYQKGTVHGIGLGGDPHHPWTAACLYWLKGHGFTK
jgi:acetyl esterase/lipase